ncbi:hypothetical protein [Metabacillus schmidteae]|uniref:hypothetical protein n=1 Tax=Metabacillus schmidteae TaxID=2730405 RepID=UPI00158E5D77|nr:hypothetical protein [Metabacillus schmidteae]
MEYEIKRCNECADPENGRFMIREADISGVVFNSSSEMNFWKYNNWSKQEFEDKELFNEILSSLQQIVQN